MSVTREIVVGAVPAASPGVAVVVSGAGVGLALLPVVLGGFGSSTAHALPSSAGLGVTITAAGSLSSSVAPGVCVTTSTDHCSVQGESTLTWLEVVTEDVLSVGVVVFTSGLPIGGGAVLVNGVLLVVGGWCAGRSRDRAALVSGVLPVIGGWCVGGSGCEGGGTGALQSM